MSQNDGFTGGFFTGVVVGGIVGGVLGAIFSARRENESLEEDKSLLQPGTEAKFSTEESIEGARRSLEAKIAQLNLAIDDVRQQLGSVNGNSSEKE